jgi:hypothetical protein
MIAFDKNVRQAASVVDLLGQGLVAVAVALIEVTAAILCLQSLPDRRSYKAGGGHTGLLNDGGDLILRQPGPMLRGIAQGG